MRKLMAAGVVAAGALGMSAVTEAAETVYEITGAFADTEHRCTQIDILFGGVDCTFGRNRAGAQPGWFGPLFAAAHYEPDGIKDQVGYVPTSGVFDPNTLTFTPAADDGKYTAPIIGTLTINDNDTPADPADDAISAQFSIGAMARNFSTGATSRAVQRWDSMNHVMPSVDVNAISTGANGQGGVDYVIGSRGFPGPRCSKTDVNDCFATDNASGVFTDFDPVTEEPVSFWTPIASGQVGIERSGLLGDPAWTNVQPPPNPPTGNVGARTTATFTNLSCDNSVSGECNTSPLAWGGGEDAGFDNVVMRISTNSLGQITEALAYYTQEYVIGFGGPPPGYDNSWQGGSFTFTGSVLSSAPNARDFAATVIADTATNTLNTVANSINFGTPITVTIVTGPAAGTATVNGDQTINYDATGVSAGEQTITYETTDGDNTDQGTITITVAADVSPVAPDGAISISTQGVAPASAIGTLNVSTLGGYLAGNAPATVSATADPNDGTASVTGGTTVRFTPAANFFTGTAVVDYTVTDINGDQDSGEITVTIDDESPVLTDGTIPATEQDTQSPALTLSIVAGNGSVAQHTLAVTTQGASGTCDISGTQIRYTPDAEFFGDDSCVVTITDGDGDSDTASFTVTVNEVDDALNLPGGGSAIDLWSLLLLGGAPLLRRRRRA